MTDTQSNLLAVCIYAAFTVAMPLYPCLIMYGFLSAPRWYLAPVTRYADLNLLEGLA